MKYAPRTALTADGRAVCARLRAEIVRTGWSETARRCGISRCNLHRAFPHLPDRSAPSFATVAAVADAVGLQLTLVERQFQGGAQ